MADRGQSETSIPRLRITERPDLVSELREICDRYRLGLLRVRDEAEYKGDDVIYAMAEEALDA